MKAKDITGEKPITKDQVKENLEDIAGILSNVNVDITDKTFTMMYGSSRKEMITKQIHRLRNMYGK